MAVAENLKKKRKEKKLTQVELAEISGVSQQAISFIESNRNTPSEGTIRLLAKALKCPVSELLEEGSERPKVLTYNEQYLLDLFSLLNESGKKLLIETAKNLVTTPEMRQEGSIASMA